MLDMAERPTIMAPRCANCKTPAYKRRLKIIACTFFCKSCIKRFTTHPSLRKAQ